MVGDLESLSFAFLVLLEQLTPVERAVFLLREVFDYNYQEIAHIINKEPTTCRQIFSRAKQHIHANRPRFNSTPEEHHQLLNQFLLAVQAGNLHDLIQLLAEDAVVYSDSGGKRPAATRPIIGIERVARFIFGLAKRAQTAFIIEIKEINGRAGVVVYDNISKLPISIFSFDIVDSKIQTIRAIINPDKLKQFEK
ncbi:MAG: hypothetical protein CUN56_06670 [Phototrophicales bacterium]|nr:MAG: hypothetical protein CUN56_06670 [Phototrophicales bacterium]